MSFRQNVFQQDVFRQDDFLLSQPIAIFHECEVSSEIYPNFEHILARDNCETNRLREMSFGKSQY